MIPDSSSFLSSRWSEGRETFISIAHLEMDPVLEATLPEKHLSILAEGI
jgi:hypothetical protein